MNMKLSARKDITWRIAVMLGAFGVFAHMAILPPLSACAFLLVTAWFVTALAAILKDLQLFAQAPRFGLRSFGVNAM